VASDVSATLGGLPHVERTLNWVRIAARFPLRILLDTPPDDLTRYGATAVIVIDK
jgi:membrane fusion protein, multidrug efflux system